MIFHAEKIRKIHDMNLNNNKKIIDDNIQEYESLRNEIISMEERQRNVWVNMYIMFGTLFVLGLQCSYYFFLFTYVILIPFQLVINDFLWSITKLSTYIRIFFEDERNDINWESFHVYNKYQEYYKKRNGGLRGIIKNSGSVHLGVISTSFFCYFALKNMFNENKFILNSDIYWILLAIILLLLILKINNEYKKEHRYELEEIIKKYKQKVKRK